MSQYIWPWKGKTVIISGGVVYTEGFISNSRVGRVETGYTGRFYIYEEGIILSSYVGEIEMSFFGNPARIVDKKGALVGNVEKTFFGKLIIVDEAGVELGEIKDLP